MGNNEVLIITAFLFTIIVLIIVRIIDRFHRFNKKTCYIAQEMRHAYDFNEYRYWRRELRCHYLCLLPFVNERNVLSLYRKIYHKAKDKDSQKRNDGLYHVLAPSAICVFICTICLCGASWAWFTSAHSNGVSNIQTATYTVSVSASDNNQTPVAVTSSNNICTISLESGKNYSITITPNGTASTGYCTVSFGGQTYHTPQIPKDTSFVFAITAYEAVDLTITPQWGTCVITESLIDSASPLVYGTEPSNSEAGITPFTMPQEPQNTIENVAPTTDIVAPVPVEPTDVEDYTTPSNDVYIPSGESTSSDTPAPNFEETTVSEPATNADNSNLTETNDLTE